MQAQSLVDIFSDDFNHTYLGRLQSLSFYGARVGPTLAGVYSSFEEAQPHTLGIRSDVERLQS